MSISPAARFRLWSLATAAYWCLMAFAMHAPLDQEELTPDWLDVPHLDKFVHGCMYAVLGFLLTTTFGVGKVRRAGRVAFGIAAAYGIVDELTQPLTGRHCDVWDYATDLLGIAIGIAVASHLAAGLAPERNDGPRGGEPRG